MQPGTKKMKQTTTLDDFRAILGTYVQQPEIVEKLVDAGLTSVDVLKDLEPGDLINFGVKNLAAKALLNAANKGTLGDCAPAAATEVKTSGGKPEETIVTSDANHEAAAPAKTTTTAKATTTPTKTTTETKTTTVETIVPKREVVDRMKGPIEHLYRRLEDQGIKAELVVACTACILLVDAKQLPSITNKDVDELMDKTSFLRRVQDNQTAVTDDDVIMDVTSDAFYKCGIKPKTSGCDGPFCGFMKMSDYLKGKVVAEIKKRREQGMK